MKQLKYITPQFYHQWLEDCPIRWERIEDNVTSQTIKFFLPLEGESNNNSNNSKDYDEYVRSKVWRPFTTDKEANNKWLIQTITPRIEVARL